MTRTENDLYTALDLDARSRHRISLRVTPGRRVDLWPMLAIAAAFALLVTAVGLGARDERAAGSPPPPPSGNSGAAGSLTSARAIIVPTMSYVVSPDTRTDDAPIYLRRPGTNEDIHIADGMVVRGVSPDVLLVVRGDGHALAYRVRERASLFSDRALRSGQTEAFVVGNALYEYSYDELVAIDARGEARSLSLPSAIETTVGPCEPLKGPRIDPRASGLRAIASADGHLFAYVSTLGNGAIVDLDNGRRLDLIDAGTALGMVTGTDGKLYALTIDGRCAANHLMVRRIDPTTMRQETAIDIGHGLPVTRIALIAATPGGTYVHEVTDTGAQLLRVESTVVTAIPLPADSGLFEAAAPDGTLYLFGGRARNVVTRFDPGTGTTETLDATKAPDGSFVAALFFVR